VVTTPTNAMDLSTPKYFENLVQMRVQQLNMTVQPSKGRGRCYWLNNASRAEG